MSMISKANRRPADTEQGSALVIVLVVAALLAALGAAVTVTANVDASVATALRTDRELLYAAEAGVERALQDIRQSTLWDNLLAGIQASSFVDPVLTPVLPGGGQLDVQARTAQLQAATPAAGVNTPQWHVFASGRFADVAGPASLDSAAYLVVWVADDPSESDGNPFADSNDVLLVHGEAVGSGGRTRALDVTVTRAGVPAGQPGLSVIAWREVRSCLSGKHPWWSSRYSPGSRRRR
jgi:hypothetical protein